MDRSQPLAEAIWSFLTTAVSNTFIQWMLNLLLQGDTTVAYCFRWPNREHLLLELLLLLVSFGSVIPEWILYWIFRIIQSITKVGLKSCSPTILLSPTFPTKPCPSEKHLNVFWAPQWSVTPPLPWADHSSCLLNEMASSHSALLPGRTKIVQLSQGAEASLLEQH